MCGYTRNDINRVSEGLTTFYSVFDVHLRSFLNASPSAVLCYIIYTCMYNILNASLRVTKTTTDGNGLILKTKTVLKARNENKKKHHVQQAKNHRQRRWFFISFRLWSYAYMYKCLPIIICTLISLISLYM